VLLLGVFRCPRRQQEPQVRELVCAAKLAGNIASYDINLTPGTKTGAYIAALTRKLGTADYFVVTPAGPSVSAQIKSSYFHLLAVLIAVLAGLGVLNAVLMATRERVHDLGVFKALGMTPIQTIVMTLCWVIVPTVIAAIIALPVGLLVQDELIRHLAKSAAECCRPDPARKLRPCSRRRRTGAADARRLGDHRGRCARPCCLGCSEQTDDDAEGGVRTDLAPHAQQPCQNVRRVRPDRTRRDV
jgi:hypothetical protein